jgi:hypothetical protein
MLFRHDGNDFQGGFEMRAALALTVLLGLGALTGEAAEGGAEFVVNSSPIATANWPDAAMSARGDSLVVWGDDSDIRGRRFDRDGVPLGGDFQAGETFQEYLGPINGAVDPRGFSVVWGDFNNRSPGDSFFRRFDRQSRPLIDPTPVGRSTGAVSVDTDRRGNSVAVAVDRSSAVIGWRFDAAGRRIGRRFQVAERGSLPQVTVDAEGGFAVLWFNEKGIFVRRFHADGNVFGPALQVTARGNDARIAGNDDGSFVVAWRSERGILARVYKPFTPRPTVTVTPRLNIAPDSVAMDAAGRFLVTWSCCFGQPASTVFGRFFEASGRPLDPPFQVSLRTDAKDDLPSAAAGPAGRFLVVWRRMYAEGGVDLIGRYLEP